MRWFWSLDAWRILINFIRSWFPWSRRILNLLVFRNKSSLNRNWILFIFLKRKLTIAWKENYFTLICFFCFKPSSSPTQLDFLEPSSPLEKQGKILNLSIHALDFLTSWSLMHPIYVLICLRNSITCYRNMPKGSINYLSIQQAIYHIRIRFL